MIRSSLLLAVALFLPVTTSAQTTETAEEIVAKALAARGGVARIKAVQSQRIEGTISFGTGDEGPFFVELKRPGKMHMEMTIEGKTIIRVYDGKSSGWIINPFAKETGVQSMTPEDLRNISDESDFDGPLVDYQAKGSTISFAGKVSLIGPPDIAGTPVLDIKLTKKDGDVRHYLFDASTYMLLKWEGTRKEGEKEIPVESFFRDYRDVDGLKFAFEIDSDTPGTQQSQQLLIKKITLNPQIDDSQFAKPAPPAKPGGAAQLLRPGEAPESDANLQRVDPRIRTGQARVGDVHESQLRAPIEFASQKVHTDSAARREIHARGSRRHLLVGEECSSFEV